MFSMIRVAPRADKEVVLEPTVEEVRRSARVAYFIHTTAVLDSASSHAALWAVGVLSERPIGELPHADYRRVKSLLELKSPIGRG